MNKVRSLAAKDERHGHPYSRYLVIIAVARRVAGLGDLDIELELGEDAARVIVERFMNPPTEKRSQPGGLGSAAAPAAAAAGASRPAAICISDSEDEVSQETVSVDESDSGGDAAAAPPSKAASAQHKPPPRQSRKGGGRSASAAGAHSGGGRDLREPDGRSRPRHADSPKAGGRDVRSGAQREHDHARRRLGRGRGDRSTRNPARYARDVRSPSQSPRTRDAASLARQQAERGDWRRDHGARKVDADTPGRWSSAAGRGRGRGGRSTPHDRRSARDGRGTGGSTSLRESLRDSSGRASLGFPKQEPGDAYRADVAARAAKAAVLASVKVDSDADVTQNAQPPLPPFPKAPDVVAPFQIGRRPLSLDLSNLDGRPSSQRSQGAGDPSATLDTQPSDPPAQAAAAAANTSEATASKTFDASASAAAGGGTTGEENAAHPKRPSVGRGRSAPRVSANRPIVVIPTDDVPRSLSTTTGAVPGAMAGTAANNDIMSIAFANGVLPDAPSHCLHHSLP